MIGATPYTCRLVYLLLFTSKLGSRLSCLDHNEDYTPASAMTSSDQLSCVCDSSPAPRQGSLPCRARAKEVIFSFDPLTLVLPDRDIRGFVPPVLFDI